MPPRLVPEDAAQVGDAPGAAAAASVAELEKRLTAQAEALEKRLAGQLFEAATAALLARLAPPTNPPPPEGTQPAKPVGAPASEGEYATAESKAAALAELRACYRTHLAAEEATRSRLGYLHLAKNGPTATEADRVFDELAHAKFCTPRRIAVSGQLDQLRRAFDDKTLDISLSAAGKARAAAAFVKAATPDKPAPTESAERRKQREQAAAARKAAATAAAADKAKAKVTK
eukprot:jgi/Tetstr1/436410/TSEL_025241.t1